MKKKRICIIAVIILVLLVLLTPVRINYEDGGSVGYKSLIYEIIKLHQLGGADDVKPYIDGFEVKIFGITVYRETNIDGKEWPYETEEVYTADEQPALSSENREQWLLQPYLEAYNRCLSGSLGLRFGEVEYRRCYATEEASLTNKPEDIKAMIPVQEALPKGMWSNYFIAGDCYLVEGYTSLEEIRDSFGEWIHPNAEFLIHYLNNCLIEFDSKVYIVYGEDTVDDAIKIDPESTVLIENYENYCIVQTDLYISDVKQEEPQILAFEWQNNEMLLIADNDITKVNDGQISKVNEVLYGEILAELKSEKQYALLDIGMYYDVLCVTDSGYEDERGNHVSASCEVYYPIDGQIVNVGRLESADNTQSLKYGVECFYVASGQEEKIFEINTEQKSLEQLENSKLNVKRTICFNSVPDVFQVSEYSPKEIAYGKMLWSAYLEGKLLDGYPLDFSDSESASENEFAFADVDCDGREELLLWWTNASMAGTTGFVFDYDGQEIYEELVKYPGMIFYDNGVVTCDWSHNQINLQEFWPYNVYRYDSKADVYKYDAGIDTVEKNGEVMKLIGDAEKIPVTFQRLTEENIAAFGCPKPYVEIPNLLLYNALENNI